MHRIAFFAFVVAQLVGLTQVANATTPANKSPYADLLPANTTLHDSPDRLDPVLLRRSTLGVVASSRYVAKMTWWQKKFGDEGERGPNGIGAVMGVTKSNQRLTAEASDPKRLADAALLQLKPRFGTVKIFDDLAAARDGGASYFLLLDFDQSLGAGFFGATGFHGWAGALLLDGSLRRVAEISVDRKTKYFSAPLLGMANAEMMAYAKSIDENFKVLLPAFSDALNASLAERGLPMPAASTPATATVPAVATPVTTPSAPVDQAFLAELAAIPTAAELYAVGDELAEKGQRAKASLAFRAILTRFPNDVLAAKAADRLADAAR